MTEQKQYGLMPRIRNFPIASPLSIEEQKEIYEGVNELKKEYEDLQGLNVTWEFDEQKGILGSNLPLLILANKVLVKKGERTPIFHEAMQLDKRRLLTNGVYRDYGIAIYNEEDPNVELAKPLIVSAKKRNWGFPILIHPASLDISKNGNYKFTKDVSLVIFGEEAREFLKDFNYHGNSGLRRLGRVNDGGGDWDSGWDDPFDSDRGGRVDWKCAEGTRANLEAKAIQEIEQIALRKQEKILQDINSKKKQALSLFE